MESSSSTQPAIQVAPSMISVWLDRLWSWNTSIKLAAATAAVAATCGFISFVFSERRKIRQQAKIQDLWEGYSSGDDTPRALAEPPQAGPSSEFSPLMEPPLVHSGCDELEE